jgi:hypothetical protein
MRGYLLELKCPISRSFEEGSAIPNEYYHQMQMQMECTKLNKCVYLETKFKHVSYSEWKDSDKKKGCYAERPGEIVYCSENVEEWTSKLEDRLSWTVRYWILEKTRSCIIDKDPQWITDHILEFQQTWNEVLEHRKNGTLPQEKQKGINHNINNLSTLCSECHNKKRISNRTNKDRSIIVLNIAFENHVRLRKEIVTIVFDISNNVDESASGIIGSGKFLHFREIEIE